MINRVFVLLIFFLGNLYLVYAQNGVTVALIKPNISEEGVIEPGFEGGEESLSKYLIERIKYPLLLVDIEMEGEVHVKVDIGKEGKVKNIDILTGFDPLADDRVVNVIESMPNWIPATKNGGKIDMPIELKISFILNDELRDYVKEQKKNGISIEEMEKSGDDTADDESDVVKSEEKNEEKSDILENKLPEFPGGKKALDAYLKENLKYPKKAVQMKIEGRVVFNITVSAEGEITSIVLYKGLYYECNEEAYYLIKRMPKWTPGLKEGQPASMQVLLPIPFVLSK